MRLPALAAPPGETGSAASVGAQRRGAAQMHGKRNADTPGGRRWSQRTGANRAAGAYG